MSDLETYIIHLESCMESHREGRTINPLCIPQKMGNAKRQIMYKNAKEKRDSARKFLETLTKK
jgi:hypothetical protein